MAVELGVLKNACGCEASIANGLAFPAGWYNTVPYIPLSRRWPIMWIADDSY
jgi:hypothetical protein